MNAVFGVFVDRIAAIGGDACGAPAQCVWFDILALTFKAQPRPVIVERAAVRTV